MPLKHATETLLVFILGLALLIAGVVVHFLPPLPGGLLPWAIAFLASIVYPLVLYPLMRARRAEYALRALHFFPALMLLGWLALQLIAIPLHGLWFLPSILRWGLGIVPVTIGMALLIWYCAEVIRQRNVRMQILGLLFLPFLFLATATERMNLSLPILASIGHSSESSSTSSVQIANLEPSEHPAEQKWRGVLRQMQRRQQRLLNREDPFAGASEGTLQSSSAPIMIAVQSSSSATQSEGTVSSRTTVDAPPRLSSTGLGLDAFVGLIVAAYGAVMQKQLKKRWNEQ